MPPRVRNGERDLIINSIPAPLDDTVQEHLYDDEFVVYCSADHRLAKRGRVTLADIAQEHWVMWSRNVPSWHHLNQAFAAKGLPAPKVAIMTSSVSLRLDIVTASDLLGLNLKRVVRQAAPHCRITELTVDGMALQLRTGVTYRKAAYLPPAARRFIEILKSTAKQIAETP